MKKTRTISIKRTVEVEIVEKSGATKRQKQVQWFPCKINAAVPFNHRMCK